MLVSYYYTVCLQLVSDFALNYTKYNSPFLRFLTVERWRRYLKHLHCRGFRNYADIRNISRLIIHYFILKQFFFLFFFFFFHCTWVYRCLTQIQILNHKKEKRNRLSNYNIQFISADNKQNLKNCNSFECIVNIVFKSKSLTIFGYRIYTSSGFWSHLNVILRI